jgi:hypothetical protein
LLLLAAAAAAALLRVAVARVAILLRQGFLCLVALP